MKTIMILASGTGGHVYPAYTISLEYLARGYKIVWVGTLKGLENNVINDERIHIEHIDSIGMRGMSKLRKILAGLILLKSIFQSYLLMKKYKPSLVLGFGGYVSVGPSLVSFVLSIPLLVHEQNSIAGTANKINYYVATKVYETFPSSFNKHDAKIIHTGNPIRKDFNSLVKPEEKYNSNISHLNILVMGGSLGALFLNKNMPFALSHFHRNSLTVKHISGKGNMDFVEKKYNSYDINSNIIEYADKISSLYDWADLIVCRAGSTSISEISKTGRAVVLIPFPHATDNHQLYNAKYLANNSAAIILEQTDDFIENFITIVNILLNDQKRIYTLSKNIQNIFPDDPVKLIVDDSLRHVKNQ